jgi:hypothetical protein
MNGNWVFGWEGLLPGLERSAGIPVTVTRWFGETN